MEKALEHVHENLDKFIKDLCSIPSVSAENRGIKKSTRKTYGIEPLIYPISVGSSPIYNFINKMCIPTVSVDVEYWGSLYMPPMKIHE